MILLHLMLAANNIMREEIMGRHHFIFGCGPQGCVVCFVDSSFPR
jgi:hypothetical protein